MRRYMEKHTTMTTARKLLIAAMAAMTLGVTACNADLTDLNRNPNSPEDVPAGTLFTYATQQAVGRWLGAGYSLRGADLMIQHLAQVQYPDEDGYSRLIGSATTGYFDGAYQVELEDLTKVIAKGRDATLAGTWGPGEVMRAWVFSNLTNTWGDIPYFEALAGDSVGGSLTPAYDDQLAIYQDLFTRLADASTALGSATNSLDDGDPIYEGDPASWRRFANSLRARFALTLINQNPTLGTAELAAAINAPGGLIDANAENAQLNWPGDGLNNNPWSVNFQGRDDHRLSLTFVDILASLGDPRIAAFAMPATRDTVDTPAITKYCPGGISPCYVGLQNALTQAQAGPYIPYTSRPTEAMYPGTTTYGTFGGSGASFPSFIFTAAEGNFILAEAAERGIGGLTPAQAPGFYNAGIDASMRQWGITSAATITAYQTSPGVLYTPGSAGLVQIAQQKWIALFTDGGTAWTEWRRTCVPRQVQAGPAAIQPTVPRRWQYSDTEYSVNRLNVAAANDDQGADEFDTRPYFDRSPTAAPTYAAIGGAAGCLGD
jgi:hypothetical protein